MSGCAFADDIAAAEATHDGGMRDARGYVTAISGAVKMRFSIYCESHFTAEDNVSSFGSMSVIGVLRVRPVAPDISVRKTFALQLRCEPSFVQHVLQTFRKDIRSKTATPSCGPQLAVGDKEGALSSSGEKIVTDLEPEARLLEEPSADASSLFADRLLSR